MQNRQVVLDTETTGLDPSQGHRIIEIGCVELVDRRLSGRHFHYYLRPDRAIDVEAQQVHGISAEFLADKPRFPDIGEAFLAFIEGAELIIHNAPFDVGFLDHELRRWRRQSRRTDQFCRILDTLELARRRHPGQNNSLDALCKRYEIDNAQRTLHGALLDAEILADVYLAMTREQVALSLDSESVTGGPNPMGHRTNGVDRPRRADLIVLRASAEERVAHRRYLDLLDKNSNGNCLWKRLETGD